METTEEGFDRAIPAELRTLLRRAPLLSSLSDDALDEMAAACELVRVPGGTRLLRAGQPLDGLIAVVHGGLRVVRRGDDGVERTLRECYRGDTLGAMSLLSDQPFPVDLYAIRDSTLIRLSRARFLALAEGQPALLLALARLLSDRAFNALEALVAPTRPSPSARGGNLAVLPLSLDPPIREATDLLVRTVGAERAITYVTADLVDRSLGPGASDVGENGRVGAWLSQLEGQADVVLYQCDPRLREWTARCRRQSDRLVMLVRGDESRRDLVRAIAEQRPDGLARPTDLVVVHHRATPLPSGTRAWSGLPDVRAIHHVRSGSPLDMARVARRLVGRPIGLVLSGGGARGLAHVGVMAAIAEAGIPIDYVCGTSMGAIFGASLALGWDIPRMRKELGELFDSPFALYDLTLPISSLLAGKKLDRVLHHQLGDGDIEDLWLPFFCVSTDLAHAKLVVHDRGCLWKSVRASCSIPGIFPPLPLDGQTLVDGGLVDNLPLDLLLERCSGPVIAVDVFPYGDPSFDRPSGRIAGWLRSLRTKLRGEPASPPLFDILVRSTLVGSKYRQQLALGGAGEIVYLEPPVASFGALQWRAHRALFDAGFYYARAQLARVRTLFPK